MSTPYCGFVVYGIEYLWFEEGYTVFEWVKTQDSVGVFSLHWVVYSNSHVW